MIHNDVLRSVRHMLNVHDDSLAAIVRLGGAHVTSDEITAYLKREEEPGYRACPNSVMASFLDGLIIHRRGPRDGPRPVEAHVTNNTVLKKLRVAFELRDDDVVAMMTAAGFAVSKPEMNALFRAPGHPNYRACGDQFLRNFLKSLTARVRSMPPSR
jgi:uncharacterized protein YehS (DUF1456 family)